MRGFEVVAVGASLGGFDALRTVLGGLPAAFAVPVVIAQHRTSDTAMDLCALLQRYSALPVREPDDKDPVAAGMVYVAPADYHLLVEGGSFALSTAAPVAYARPSIDVLFESVADSYGERAIGVILTGTSRDGVRGLARIKERGGMAMVQHPHSAARRALPAAALAATAVDHCLPLQEIAPALARLCAL